MVVPLTVGRSASVPPPLLADKAAVADQLPKLMAMQVARLLRDAQRAEQALDWSTLNVQLRPDPIYGFLVVATATVKA